MSKLIKKELKTYRRELINRPKRVKMPVEHFAITVRVIEDFRIDINNANSLQLNVLIISH